MAFIGVYGTHALGKTTAILRLLDEYKGDGREITAVIADQNKELWWEGSQLKEYKYKGRAYWKGSVEDKLGMIQACASCPTEVVVCESSRPVLEPTVEAHNRHGGVYIVMLTCCAATFRKFLSDRCVSKGKQFNAEYWDERKLRYEGSLRYIRAAEKYYTPAGVPWVQFEIDPQREAWTGVLAHIKEQIDIMLPV